MELGKELRGYSYSGFKEKSNKLMYIIVYKVAIDKGSQM